MIAHFHMRSGHICSFELDVADPAALVKAIKPREIFKRTAHLIMGPLMLVTLNPPEIEWIELEAKGVVKLPGLAEVLSINALSQEEFNARVAKNKVAMKTIMEQKILPTALLAYGKAVFKSGRTLLLETQAQFLNAKTRLSGAVMIFEQSAVFVKTETGLLIVNPQNIAIWQVVPGITEGPPHAIKGACLKITDEKAKRSA